MKKPTDLTRPPREARDAMTTLVALPAQIAEVRKTARNEIQSIRKDANLSQEGMSRKVASTITAAQQKIRTSALGALTKSVGFREGLENAEREVFDRDPLAIPHIGANSVAAADQATAQLMRLQIDRSNRLLHLEYRRRVDELLDRALKDSSGEDLAKLHDSVIASGDAGLLYNFEHAGAARVEAEASKEHHEVLQASIWQRRRESLSEEAMELFEFADAMAAADPVVDTVIAESETEVFYTEGTSAGLSAWAELVPSALEEVSNG